MRTYVPMRTYVHMYRDLGGADAVAGDVDHVVDAARDPVVAVLVTPARVPRHVLVTGDHLPLHIYTQNIYRPPLRTRDGRSSPANMSYTHTIDSRRQHIYV